MLPCFPKSSENRFSGRLCVLRQTLHRLLIEAQQGFQRHRACFRVGSFVFGDLILQLSASQFPVRRVERSPFCLAVTLKYGVVFLCR